MRNKTTIEQKLEELAAEVRKLGAEPLTISQACAERVVAAVLMNLTDRRPFKVYLADLESKEPFLWNEMLLQMRQHVQLAVAKVDVQEEDEWSWLRREES